MQFIDCLRIRRARQTALHVHVQTNADACTFTKRPFVQDALESETSASIEDTRDNIVHVTGNLGFKLHHLPL